MWWQGNKIWLFSPEDGTVFFQYQITAKEYRRRVQWLFYAIAAAFGIVARLFFLPSWLDAAMISLGLIALLFFGMPPSILQYRLTESRIDSVDLTGDRFHLQEWLPLVAGGALFFLLAASCGPETYLILGVGLGFLLVGARRIFPKKTGRELSMQWAAVTAVTEDATRDAFLLTGTLTGDRHRSLLVLCPQEDFTRIAAFIRTHAPQAAWVVGPALA